MVQAAVADPTSIEGALIKGPWAEEIISRTCETDLAAGRLLKRGTDPETQVREMPVLPTADVDSIATAAVVLAAVTAQEITSGNFDGVIGADKIAPCMTLSINFDASTDWDIAAGINVVFYGHDALGAEIMDNTINKPTGSGAVAYHTQQAFASVYMVTISAGSAATGGAATIGTTVDKVECSPADFPGLSIYRPIKEPNTALRNFAQYEAVDVLMRGRLMCVPEHAVSYGDQVYVRYLEAGNDLRGQLTGQDGAATPATYAKLAGAKWVSAAAADGYAIVELAGA